MKAKCETCQHFKPFSDQGPADMDRIAWPDGGRCAIRGSWMWHARGLGCIKDGAHFGCIHHEPQAPQLLPCRRCQSTNVSVLSNDSIKYPRYFGKCADCGRLGKGALDEENAAIIWDALFGLDTPQQTDEQWYEVLEHEREEGKFLLEHAREESGRRWEKVVELIAENRQLRDMVHSTYNELSQMPRSFFGEPANYDDIPDIISNIMKRNAELENPVDGVLVSPGGCVNCGAVASWKRMVDGTRYCGSCNQPYFVVPVTQLSSMEAVAYPLLCKDCGADTNTTIRNGRLWCTVCDSYKGVFTVAPPTPKEEDQTQ